MSMRNLLTRLTEYETPLEAVFKSILLVLLELAGIAAVIGALLLYCYCYRVFHC